MASSVSSMHSYSSHSRAAADEEECDEEKSIFRKMDMQALPLNADDEDISFIEEDAYKLQMMEQLRLAQGSNLLVFSRDKIITNLARKLRPQFAHLYVCGEYKDCSSLLMKVKNTHMDPLGVDVMIAELDPMSIKIAEYINSRASQPDTNNCPLIPMIFLYHPTDGAELLGNLKSAGGASRLIAVPFKTREMFYVIIDLLQRRKKVEETFVDLTKENHGDMKYPYVPLYEPDEVIDANVPTMKSAATVASCNSGSVAMNVLTAEVENVDDWTDCPSLMPEFLRSHKKTDSGITSQSKKDDDDPRNTRLMRAVSNDDSFNEANLEGSVSTAPSFPKDVVSPDLFPSKRSTKSMSSLRGAGKCEFLLDPRNRPQYESKNLINQTKDGDKNTLDLFPFFNKPAPEITPQIVNSVSGLTKSSVMHHWTTVKQLRDSGGGGFHNGSRNKPNTQKRAETAPSSHLSSSLDINATTGSTVASISSPGTSVDFKPMTVSSAVGSPATSRRPSTTGGKLGFAHKNPIFKTIANAKKKIEIVSKNSSYDTRFEHLLKINLNHRVISTGEKDALEKGLNAEELGDIEKALYVFRTAGQGSKEPHLAQILIGNLRFKQTRFQASLKAYTAAVSSIEAKSESAESLRLQKDEFIANYNRAIINFRLGDDEAGALDLERALVLNPLHIEARKLLMVVHRRMGMFKKAVSESVKIKVLFNEQVRYEKVERARHRKELKEHERQRREEYKLNHPSNTVTSSSSVSRHTSSNNTTVSNLPALSCEESNPAVSTSFQQGVQLPDPLPNTMNSVKERIITAAAMDSSFVEDGSYNDEAGGGGAVRLFRLQHDLKERLFDDMWMKPTELQQALLQSPGSRTAHNIEIISTTLRLFPFCRGFDDNLISNLANAVEYRAIADKDTTLFSQGGQSSAVCLLLKGDIQVKMRTSLANFNQIIVGNVKSYDMFGHIDILFHKMNTFMLTEIKNILKGRSQDAKFDRFVRSMEMDKLMKTVSTDQMESDGLDEKSFDEDDEASRDEVLDRSVNAGMFSSYQLISMCEILMLDKSFFKTYLMAPIMEEFKSRLQTICSSGVFDSWSAFDIIRLARMGTVKAFPKGETLLRQAKAPDYLYIIVSGMCKVYKKATRTEILSDKLQKAKAKAERYDMKYVFDHSLRTAPGAVVASEHKTLLQRQITKNRGVAVPSGSTVTTECEYTRFKLGLDIENLTKLYDRAVRDDRRDEELYAEDCDEYELDHGDGTGHSPGQKAKTSNVNKHVLEITTLHWPRIFGEACLTDPLNGQAKGTITTDTAVKVFMVHRSQLQTFPIDNATIGRARIKSVVYPTDSTISNTLRRNKEWTTCKSKIVGKVSQSRWPAKVTALEPFKCS